MLPIFRIEGGLCSSWRALLVPMAIIFGASCATTKSSTEGTAKKPVVAAPQHAPGELAVQPQRHLSGGARRELKDEVQAYEAAPGARTNSSACASAADRFADLYSKHPTLVEAKFNEAVVYENCGNEQKAERLYRDLLNHHPHFGPALNNVGAMAYRRGDESTAVQYFQEAATAKNSDAYVNLAIIERNRSLRGDRNAVKEAINNVHRALAVDSYNIEAYSLLATLVYDHAREHAELEIARLICVQAMKQAPNYAPVYNVLGLVLLRMDEVARALTQFRKAVALDPQLIQAHMNVGAITLNFRDYKSAEEAFQHVLQLNSDKQTRLQATIGLGVAARGQRRFQDAMKYYKQAESMDPGNSAATYNMAVLIQDYLFNPANPAMAVSQLTEAEGLLNRFMSQTHDANKRHDAERRIRNIQELIPMLRDQQSGGGK